ncbi:MAG: hypothetical protein ACFB11_04390 [Paracoccaceae bacterium]
MGRNSFIALITIAATLIIAVSARAHEPDFLENRSVVSAAQNDRVCDPNYASACVPVASDVDCSAGSGNGPAYVAGSVRVVGLDVYGLDRDNDGIGCERD